MYQIQLLLGCVMLGEITALSKTPTRREGKEKEWEGKTNGRNGERYEEIEWSSGQ